MAKSHKFPNHCDMNPKFAKLLPKIRLLDFSIKFAVEPWSLIFMKYILEAIQIRANAAKWNSCTVKQLQLVIQIK